MKLFRYFSFLAKAIVSGVVRCFQRKTAPQATTPIPDYKSHLIYLKKQGERAWQSYSITEYEMLMDVRYLPVLTAENEGIYLLVRARCDFLAKRGRLQNGKWLGSYYGKELAEGTVAPIYIAWVDDIKEWGLFARSSIPVDTFVGEYAGLLTLISFFSHNLNPYCFHYPLPISEWLWFTIDPAKIGNETRFMNHSETANCSALTAYTNGFLRIAICTNRAIAADEELTFDYGPTLMGKKRFFRI